MDRPQTLSTAPSSASKAASGPFAYQTRLLERTSSVSRASPLARTRSSSQTTNASVLSNTTGSSGPSALPRRWTGSHRVANSMDMVRGKWEERSRDTGEAPLPLVSSPSPTKDVFPRMHSKSTSAQSAASTSSDHHTDPGDPIQLDNSMKDLPPTPSTPSRIDAVRDRWEVRSRETDAPPSPSWSSAKDPSRFSPLNPSFTSSSTSSSAVSSSTGSGIDAVRGRWEERLSSSSPSKESFRPSSSSGLSSYGQSPSPTKSRHDSDFQRTPTYLKRQTMPAPIIANALSPNTTGVSVEVDSPTSSTPSRIRLPLSATPSQSSLSQSSLSQFDRAHPSTPSTPTRLRGSTIAEASTPTIPSIHVRDTDNTQDPPPRRRPLSSQGFYSHISSSTDRFQRHAEPQKPALKPEPEPASKPASSSPSNSVMAPAPYRSSYMAGKSKKLDSYRDSLGVNSHRKLGRHLPRIASGDADESWEARDQPTPPLPPPDMPRFQAPSIASAAIPPRDDVSARREKRLARLRDMKQDSNLPSQAIPPSADDVAGLPGRISLKAPKGDQAPVPSARLLGATWADRQRHLIQAYEYLCHVGEAQQWIEGCLGEELEFGVVEMEEGLRNGVVLAKLVRAFEGPQVVRRIYEAPKLDFRHSDNINIFFDFLQKEGLPEGFIFELTDLYNKKNIPKVIYCIHALSHLLARRGKAQRIGNLIGQLQFSDDQLTKTQKGLKDAGVSMPNFGNVGKELAKEINEEPEVEVETEDERRDRLLLENEESIIRLQACCRGVLSRRGHKALLARIKLSEKHIVKFQTHCFGALLRRRLQQRRRVQSQLVPWATAVQARARAAIVRQQWKRHLRKIQATSPQVSKVQAQIRGVLMRRRYAKMKAALQKMAFSFTKIQAVARAHVTRHARSQLQKTFYKPQVNFSIVGLQAHGRALIIRRRLSLLVRALSRREKAFVGLQAQCRGILVRRRMRAQMAKIRTATDVVISIQSAVRTYLARKRLLGLIRGLRKATPFIVGLQSQARANLMRQEHKSVEKALRHVHTVTSVQSFQALARASLTRKKHQQLNKTLEIATPDVLNLQSVARGFLVRQEYYAWRDHLHRSHPIATILQAMLRGAVQRRAFYEKLNYFKANLNKVVKIQSLFRAKETREQYRQLTLGKNVSVSTIKNFVHLLDDSEADFQEEIKIERLRKKVVEAIRENQALENDVNELDVKIALVVQNAMNYEDLLKAKKKYGGDSAVSQAARASLLAAHGDPFSGPNTLDQEARRKLELYQQLFYLLQSRGEYLSRLFIRLNQVKYPDTSRRFIERVVLTLFGYGQDHREDFLLLKLFQFSIRDQIAIASSVNDVMEGSTMYLNVAVHYLRPKQATYVREAFRPILKEVIESDDLNLEVDPVIIHRLRIEHEEMRSGRASNKPKDVSFRDAISDPETRPIYIRHLQTLHWWTKRFLEEITKSTRKMPFGVRYLSRELLICLQHKFPDASDELRARCVGRLVYYRYINPAIITPETFDVVSKTVDVASRKNLAQISKVLTQIANGEPFEEDSPYAPLNDYVQEAIGEMNAWFLTVADVPDAETQYHAHEFLDVTVQPKPIYISPNEIYSLHSLLSENQDFLAAKDDPLRIILSELGGVPHLDNEELKDARDTAITLDLTNRFASVQDPHAEEKTLWVQAKRGVLAILRVQPAQDLLESLMRPVTENDEMVWEDILEAEMENEIKQMPRRQPSAAVPDSAYRLEDIRSLKFAAVKALAIQNLLELERQGKITRNDGFQGILNAIAGDVRSKHRKRIQRQIEMDNMSEALRQLGDRKKHFLEQIDSYHSYVDSAMSTMQRGGKKKRLVLPFTRQFYHERELEKTGQRPKYGSYLYTAKKLYDREILLSIDGYSPRQFDKLNITLSSNAPGIFNILLESNMLAVVSRIGSEDIKMEDLLQAKYERRASLSLLGGKMKVNFELFLLQVNKKFYGS